jgi:DNA-binding MarR family transcriptional regulator
MPPDPSKGTDPRSATDVTPLVEALEQLVLSAIALTARVLAEVAPDLTFLQWRVLVVLGADDGARAVRVSDVASELGARLPATSRVLARLRARNLIEIAPDDHDRRVRTVRLTPEGVSLREAVLAQRRSELTWAVHAHRLAFADTGAARRIALALQRLG